MHNLLIKECRLSASPLTYWFLAAALLVFAPGYPVLMAVFLITLGIFYSFQTARENNDLPFSLLLPVAKGDIVKGKYAFTVLVEACGFLLLTAFTLIRMLFFRDVAVYRDNALMGANLAFLGFALVLFGCFNAVFLGGFFKTGYAFGKPFILYSISALLVILAAEALHHIPGLESVNALGFTPFMPQGIILPAGALIFAALTALSLRRSVRSFARIDIS